MSNRRDFVKKTGLGFLGASLLPQTLFAEKKRCKNHNFTYK